MIAFFKTILYEPMLNLLVFLYNNIPGADLGVAIILLTILIRLILLPLSQKSIKAQKSLKTIQPEIDKIKNKYEDKEKQSKEMMKLYKKYKVNPFSSCLPLLIQLPVLIAMFQVFRSGLSNAALPLYSFIKDPGVLNPIAFGFLDLSEPSWILALITAGFQYIQTKMMPRPAGSSSKKGKKTGMGAIMGGQMKFLMPAITFFIGITLPSGLILYWLITVLVSIIQNKYTQADSIKPEIKSNSIEK